MDPRIKTALVSVNPTSKNPAWHGAPTALGVLRSVSAATAVWRPYPGADNIREIALHIAFWENSVANRIGGTNLQLGYKQRKTGWAVRRDEIDEKSWKDEVKMIKAAHARLVESVTHFDPRKLDKPGGKHTSRNAVEFIHGVGEHSLYHTAEMKIIKSYAKFAGKG